VVELPGEVMLTVTGDVDIAVTREFRRRLDNAVRPGGALLIDLTAVTFLGGRRSPGPPYVPAHGRSRNAMNPGSRQSRS